MAVDTMSERALLAKKLARRNLDLLIDVRIGGPVMQCYFVRGRSDLGWYHDTLHSDSEAWGDTCADSPEPQVAVGAAAFIAGAVTAHLRGREIPRRIAIDFHTAAFVVETRELPDPGASRSEGPHP